MPEEKIEAKNKTVKIAIISAVVVLSALLGAYLYWQDGRDATVPPPADDGEKAEAEADMIRELNKEAIRTAQNTVDSGVRPIGAEDHYQGELTAPVQIVAYMDYECPFSVEYFSALEAARENFGGQLSVAFRHFPLATHASAITAALAAECAAEQGKFWEMSERLFAANLENNFFPDRFKEDAAGLGLDRPKFNQCLDTEKYLDKIETQMLEARDYGVLGTPANFINAIPYAGALPLEDFTDSTGRPREGLKTIIEKELSKK